MQGSPEKSEDDGGWHLDKRVPIAIIVTLILQTGGLVSFVTNLNSRVALVEARTERFERERDGNRDRLSAVEYTTKTILLSVERIEKKLEK